MWAYHKCIPISNLRREYPGHPDEALEIAKMRFVEECGEVLGKAVNVSVKRDPQKHAYILMAELITEPQEADMATMGCYGSGRMVRYVPPKKRVRRIAGEGLIPLPKAKKRPLFSSYREDLRSEINEWLKI